MNAACRDARNLLLRDADGATAHCATCAACHAFAGRLRRVDDALAHDREHDGALPPHLRARILEATVAAVGSPADDRTVQRGRLLDLFVRGAAVAAVLAGLAVALPAPVAAAEFDAHALGAWSERTLHALRDPGGLDLGAALSSRSFLEVTTPPVEHAGLLGATALCLVSAGVGLLVRERRR